MAPHPTSLRSILILSSHLCVGLPSALLPWGLSTKTRMQLSCHPYVPHVQPISSLLILSPELYLVRSTDHKFPSYVVFSIPMSPRHPLVQYSRTPSAYNTHTHHAVKVLKQHGVKQQRYEYVPDEVHHGVLTTSAPCAINKSRCKYPACEHRKCVYTIVSKFT